jgi:hypothetical protein
MTFNGKKTILYLHHFIADKDTLSLAKNLEQHIFLSACQKGTQNYVFNAPLTESLRTKSQLNESQ